MANKPMISVILSVYNAERYLEEAVESILGQTYGDFELIAINDGSTDGSLKILKSFVDKRMRIVSRENKGLTYSLNEGIGLARGKYIARQDADDLSLPDRFEREVAYLEKNPDVGLVGSNYIIMDEEGREVARTHVLCHPDDLKVAEGLSNQYGHGSVMMRKSVLEKVGEYDKSVGMVEDYDLFARIAHVAKIANIPRPLYKWRRNPVGISLSNEEKQLEQAHAIRDREYEYMMKNRGEYRLFASFHPTVFDGGLPTYLSKKSVLFRNLGYLSWHKSHNRFAALGMLLIATAFRPWSRRNIRSILAVISRKRPPESWKYEFI